MTEQGPASKLHPKTYKGKEDSGGYLAQNAHPTSRNSPQWRGRIYLAGVGWFWLSGWIREGKSGELLSITARGMTDQEVERYCAPHGNTPRKGPQQKRAAPAGYDDDDPPFQ